MLFLPKKIHRVYVCTYVDQGQASDIAIQAQEILNLRKQLNGLYVTHTKQPLDVIERSMERDNFMSPQDAINFGLVDSIINKRQLATPLAASSSSSK